MATYIIPQGIDFRLWVVNTNTNVNLGGSNATGPILIWDYRGGRGNQMWQFVLQGNGSYYIKSEVTDADGNPVYASSPSVGGLLSGSPTPRHYLVDTGAFPFIIIWDGQYNYWTSEGEEKQMTTQGRSYRVERSPPQVFQLEKP